MSESLESRVNRLVDASKTVDDQQAALTAAIEKAKPAAFAALEEKAREAADLLRSRGIPTETAKDVTLRYESKKKFLSSRVIQVPVPGPRIVGWILHQSLRSTDRGNALYNSDPSWYGGMVMGNEGKLYSFKDDAAMPVKSFDMAVAAIGSTNAYSLDRVDELAAFWEDKVVQATARVIRGEPYSKT